MLIHRLLAVAALLFVVGSAQAADMGMAATDYGSCGEAGVLKNIKGRFAWAERNTWHRGFTMSAIGNPRASGHPFAEPGMVKRDFCVADAVMTDGLSYQVFYAVEHGLGFAGIGRYVDFCVLGLEPWHVHDGACRTVR